MRLIDADKYKDGIRLIMQCWNCSPCLSPSEAKRATDDLRVALNELDNMPTIDAEPVKHGYWVNAYPDIEPNPMFMYGICSECGFKQSISNSLKFCPECGTKMDKE